MATNDTRLRVLFGGVFPFLWYPPPRKRMSARTCISPAQPRRRFSHHVLGVGSIALALAACAPDTIVTSSAGVGAANVGPHAPAYDVTPTLSTHFAFFFNARPTSLFQVALDVVTPNQFSELTKTTKVDVGQFNSVVPSMGDVGNPGNKEMVMITTYGAATAQCTSDAWSSLSDELQVGIKCNDMLTGQPADVPQAVLIVGNNSLGTPSAFTIANQPTAASYVPDTAVSYTSGTGAMLIQRIGTGDWYVNVGTGSPQGSTYLVNSFDARVVCTIAEWKNFGIRARCFDRTGALVDAPFKVLQIGAGRTGFPFAFAWADQRSLTTTYVPNPSASRGTSITSTRISAGTYDVAFAGFATHDTLPENVQLTAFSGAYSACAVVSKGDSGTSRVVRVECRDSFGRPADSRFNIFLTR